jgi:hypothetical protein
MTFSMNPEFLLGGTEANDQNIGSGFPDLAQDPLLLGLIVFEAERRTIGLDDIDRRPLRAYARSGAIGNARRSTEKINPKGALGISRIEEGWHKVRARHPLWQTTSEDAGCQNDGEPIGQNQIGIEISLPQPIMLLEHDGMVSIGRNDVATSPDWLVDPSENLANGVTHANGVNSDTEKIDPRAGRQMNLLSNVAGLSHDPPDQTRFTLPLAVFLCR